MKVAPIPENEKARIEALREYNILDTLPEKAYEDITKIASAICQIPIALISLIDEDRQWFKSHHGLNLIETSRDISFCSHALDADSGIFIIKDAREDLRFSDNPLVTGSPNIVFYAGVPLISTDGFSLGTLCVIDDKLRELDQNQIDSLKALSNQVVKLFELRKKNRLLDESLAEMENRNIELQKFAYSFFSISLSAKILFKGDLIS